MFEKIDNEIKSFFFKIIVPSLIAITIKLSIIMRNEKLTLFRAISTTVCGIGCAYLAGPLVMSRCHPDWIFAVIGVITMGGEKIAHYLIFKFNIEAIGNAFTDFLIDRIRRN